ncbi:MAG: hypothetical protein R3315_02905 [Woeseiaceae bacterium]|nr:hypothetical protein [Woeseiaceae bacterium]
MLRYALMLAASLLAATQTGSSHGLEHRVSVRDTMLAVIGPATYTIWGVESPQTDEDWLPLEQAAITVILAGSVLMEGGSEVADRNRANDPRWRELTRDMIVAAEDALQAARRRDLQTFVEVTNDDLYAPCEECHKAFPPVVR